MRFVSLSTTFGLCVMLCATGGCFAAPSGSSTSDSSESVGDESASDSTTADEESGEETQGDAMGEIRVVHGSAEAGPVDVYEAGSETPVFEGLAYGDASDWTELEPGPFDFEIRAADASPLSLPLTFGSIDIPENGRVNAVAAGVPDGEADEELRLISVLEDWGNDVAGRARVRFVHAGADAPEIAFEGAGDETIEIERFEASDGTGATIEAEGGVRLSVANADADVEITTFTSSAFTDGDEVLLVATGRTGALAREADGFRLLAIGSEGPLEPMLQDPELFILHGSRDAQAVEVCAETQELAANFSYGELQSTRVSPGVFDLKLYDYPAGCTGTALNGDGNLTDELEAGERYMLLVTGERTPDAGEAGIQVAPFQDAFTLDDEENLRVRFIHGASYTQIYVGGVVNGAIDGPNVFTDPIAWRAESTEATIPSGPATLGIADAVGEPEPPYSPIVTFDVLAGAGRRQWGIVAGDPSPNDNEDGFLQLLVVDTSVPGWQVAQIDINE